MQKFSWFVCSLIVILACNSSKKTSGEKTGLPAVQLKDGWELLFDGKTTRGWHKYGGAAVGSAWKIADGAIYLDTSVKKDWQIDSGGDIATDQEFENFDLKLEWKIAKNGNSGVMFYVHEDKQFNYPWETGPEMQVLDNIGAPDNKKENHLAGTLYDLSGTAEKSKPKPVGEWNQVEIISVNGKLDLILILSTSYQLIYGMITGKKWSPAANSNQCRVLAPIKKVALHYRTMEIWFGSGIL